MNEKEPTTEELMALLNEDETKTQTVETTSNQKGKKHRNGIAVLIGNIEDRCEQFPELLKCAETNTYLEFLRTIEVEVAERQKTAKADRILENQLRGMPPEVFKKKILRRIEIYRRANPDVKVAI